MLTVHHNHHIGAVELITRYRIVTQTIKCQLNVLSLLWLIANIRLGAAAAAGLTVRK